MKWNNCKNEINKMKWIFACEVWPQSIRYGLIFGSIKTTGSQIVMIPSKSQSPNVRTRPPSISGFFPSIDIKIKCVSFFVCDSKSCYAIQITQSISNMLLNRNDKKIDKFPFWWTCFLWIYHRISLAFN